MRFNVCLIKIYHRLSVGALLVALLRHAQLDVNILLRGIRKVVQSLIRIIWGELLGIQRLGFLHFIQLLKLIFKLLQGFI